MQFRTSLSFVHNASRQHIIGLFCLQSVKLCYGLRGIYGRFDSKIRFENESDGRFDSRFDSNEKKTIRRSLTKTLVHAFIASRLDYCNAVFLALQTNCFAACSPYKTLPLGWYRALRDQTIFHQCVVSCNGCRSGSVFFSR